MACFSHIDGWYKPDAPPFRPGLPVPNRLRSTRRVSREQALTRKPETVHGNGAIPIHCAGFPSWREILCSRLRSGVP